MESPTVGLCSAEQGLIFFDPMPTDIVCAAGGSISQEHWPWNCWQVDVLQSFTESSGWQLGAKKFYARMRAIVDIRAAVTGSSKADSMAKFRAAFREKSYAPSFRGRNLHLSVSDLM